VTHTNDTAGSSGGDAASAPSRYQRRPLLRLAHGTLIYGMGGALTKFVALLLLPIFTAYLSPAEYGVVAMLALFSAAATALFSCGLGVSIGICYHKDETPGHRHAAIWTAFVILALCVAMLLAASAYVYRDAGTLMFGSPQYDGLVLLTLLATGAGILVQPFSLSCQFREKALTFVAISVAASLAGTATSLYLVVALGLGATGVVLGIVVTQVVAFGLFVAECWRNVPFALDRRAAGSLMRHGLPMVPSFLSLYVLQLGGQFILKEISGLDALGVYSVGLSLGMAMSLLVSAFTSAWPQFFLSYWGDRAGAKSVFRKAFTWYVLVFGAASLLFFVWATPVVLAMAAPGYFASHSVVGWVAVAQFLSGAFSILLPAAYFSRRLGVIVPIQTVAALVSIGAACLLVPQRGIEGAAQALALGYLAMCALLYAWNRIGQEEFTLSYDWRRIAWFAAGYAFIVLVAGYGPAAGFRGELLKSVAGSILICVLVLVLLTAGERRAIREAVRAMTRPVAQ